VRPDRVRCHGARQEDEGFKVSPAAAFLVLLSASAGARLVAPDLRSRSNGLDAVLGEELVLLVVVVVMACVTGIEGDGFIQPLLDRFRFLVPALVLVEILQPLG